MTPVDIALLALLITGLVFSIIELGLSAYLVSFWDQYDRYYYGSVPGILSFLLFASLWTLLRTAFRLVRLILKSKSEVDGSGRPAPWVAILTLVINAVTMIFWLAGFAAFVSLLEGATAIGVSGALLAFAVMLWLVFLALLTINILTACGVLKSENGDYAPLVNKKGSGVGVEKTQASGANPEGPVPEAEIQ